MSDPLFDDVLSLCHYDDSVTWLDDVLGFIWGSTNYTYSTTSPKFGAGNAEGTGAVGSQLSTPLGLDYTQPFTFEGSFLFDSVTALQGVFNLGGSTADNSFKCNLTSSGQINIYVKDGVELCNFTTTDLSLAADTWVAVAMGFNGTDLYLYVDGQPYLIPAGSGNGFLDFVSDSTQHRWGGAFVSGTSIGLDGRIDETRITQADRYGGVAYTPATEPFPDFGDVVPPTITTQPVDTSTPVGGHAYFFCEATGTTGILYYQWYRVPDTILLGQKGQYLDFYNTPDRLDGEQYYCIATDDGGSVTSDTATLTVISETLQITSQPSSVSVTVGQGVSFSVVAADATGTINYQWKDNGANVGTNASIYTIASTVTLDNGSIITVDVSDDLSTVTSDDALLTVFTPPPYPPGFPCPTWQYSNQTTGFQRRTPFDSGWTRQRRQFGLTGTSVNLSFKVSTEGFADFNDWISANGFEWFDIDLDRYGGSRVTQTMRFVSAIQYSYSNFDVIYATVTGEFKND